MSRHATPAALRAACLLLAALPAMVLPVIARADDAADVRALETRRLEAINTQDAAAFRRILAVDYVHVHATGKVDTRDGFIQNILDSRRVTERGPLAVRVYGNGAVMLGEQVNHTTAADGSQRDQRLMVTQVAIRGSAGWQFVSMQTTTMSNNNGRNVPEDTTYPPQPRVSRAEQALIDLEARRAKAIANADFDTLKGVLADDYTHVYGSGRIGDRADYIDQVRKAPRVPMRGPLRVRLYGDIAVMTGDLLNKIQYGVDGPHPDRPDTVLDTVVTQVARRERGQWKFVAFQITAKAAN